MRTLRWGVIGLGRIVKSTIAPAMVAEPECELVAGVSRDQARADAFAQEFGAPYAYTSYDEMLANPEVEAVYIATPNAQHFEQVVAAAEAGKHVWCDKPMAVTVADAVREVEACDKAGVKLGINFHNRQLPWVRDVKQMVAAGAIGDVRTIQVEASAGVRPHEGWRNDPELAGIGTTFNVGVHVYDFLSYILDSDPVEVVAMWDDDNFAVEIQALALIRFANGVTAYVNCNQRLPHPQNDIDIYGTTGRIVGHGVTRSREDGRLVITKADGSESMTAYPSPGAHRLSLAAYAKAVLDGETPNASGEDGLRSMRLCEAMARSVAERRVVDIEY
ncbi:MAG TPA: Gfo/Idh/MocA family oxidoreductase [Nocardioidaceae bacterium]|nr:Gfo/Idh/MocA family oxidoreductase [Nocardioidaceae bacterium]